MDDKAVLLIVLGLVAVPAAGFFFIKLKRAQDEIRELIERRFAGRTIHLRDPLALHVAQSSRGFQQRRGRGNLILSDEELFFAMPMPRVVLSIPVDTIGEIERVSRMCGQNPGKPFLSIHFRNASGEDDALGVHVKEMDRWEAEIRQRQTSAAVR